MTIFSVHIRLMREDDLDHVVAIDRMSFSLPWPENSYRYELFENKNSRLWVAELTDLAGVVKVVGAVVVWLIIDEAHIATLAVHPDYRRMGIGQRLLVEVLKDARQMGMVTTTLEVRLGNQAAQELYRKFGFQIVGHRPRYYRDNHEDALIMTVEMKKLPVELILAGSDRVLDV